MGENTSFVGLDVHKATIAVAVAEAGRNGEVRFLGEVSNDVTALDRLAARLEKGGRYLRFCYEAGPCGYGVYRHLSDRGHECIVVAPSQIPRKPGDRVKTDRRDAVMLASLHRAGQLTPIWVPDAGHEAMRDLVRARAAAVASGRAARQQLLGFLLRHGRRFEGKPWSRTHRAWVAGQRFDHPAGQIVLQDLIDTVDAAAERVARLTRQIEVQVAEWSLAPLVIALQAMRGVALIVAVTLVAELGDLRRFAGPAQLMAYAGLVPTERSSGPKTRRGGITKTGNGEVRKTLIEAAGPIAGRLASANSSSDASTPRRSPCGRSRGRRRCGFVPATDVSPQASRCRSSSRRSRARCWGSFGRSGRRCIPPQPDAQRPLNPPMRRAGGGAAVGEPSGAPLGGSTIHARQKTEAAPRRTVVMR
jgi:transposase